MNSKQLNRIQLSLYKTIVVMFQTLCVTPSDAIPVLRAIADDAEFFIKAKAQGMTTEEAVEARSNDEMSIGKSKMSESQEVKMLENMLNLDSIN
jgi:hypothetical protein